MKQRQIITLRDSRDRKQQIEVIYQDEELLVVNKPPGLRVIPDHWNPFLPNLRDILKSKLFPVSSPNRQNIWVVHRIDADTSGLVLFALTPEMHRSLNKMFERGEIEKTYLAIVQGAPPATEGSIDLPLQHHPTRKQFMMVHKRGKPSVTQYRLLEKFNHFSLLEVKPLTGRTHQIRVHLKEIGCPLAVDPLYGTAESISMLNLKPGYTRGSKEEIPLLLNRLSLHAFRLTFEHPVRKEKMQLEAPPPRDFMALLKALRKWDK